MLPTVWLASGWYASYWNAVLFKLGLNCEMYSWVVHFLNYFVSISERDVGTERQQVEGVGNLKVFLNLFIFVNSFCTVFLTIIIIKCKVSFSSHSS